jgi:hypothetical protein
MATPTNNPCGTIDGIEFEEPVGSATLQFGVESARGERIFHIDWTDRETFSIALLGGYTTNGEQTIYYDQKQFPGFTGIICRSVNIEGFGVMSADANGDPAYQYAKVSATYESNAQNRNNGGTQQELIIATEEMDISYDTLDVPIAAMRFASTQRELAEPLLVAKRVPMIRHTITEEKSPTDRKEAIKSLAGKVNGTIFLGVEPGYLLYEGSRTRRTITADGSQPYQIIHSFIERVQGKWNEVWDPIVNGTEAPRYDSVERTDDGHTAVKFYDDDDDNDFSILIA